MIRNTFFIPSLAFVLLLVACETDITPEFNCVDDNEAIGACLTIDGAPVRYAEGSGTGLGYFPHNNQLLISLSRGKMLNAEGDEVSAPNLQALFEVHTETLEFIQYTAYAASFESNTFIQGSINLVADNNSPPNPELLQYKGELSLTFHNNEGNELLISGTFSFDP
tara:strand:+ start:233 stop:730 length:498 start_codon:yes stop_codon:yes gene_type:complete